MNETEGNSKELLKTVTKDDDGHESVTEYYEKQKTGREGSKELSNEAKKKKKEKSEEDIKKTIQTVGNVVTSIPHYIPYVLAAGAGGGLKWFIDQMQGKGNDGKK